VISCDNYQARHADVSFSGFRADTSRICDSAAEITEDHHGVKIVVSVA
jgi:hypothetical protein